MESTLGIIGTILGIVLGFGAIGAWLVIYGRHLAEQAENRKDIDGIGRKVENIRKELQGQIDKADEKHNALAREVAEISVTTKSTEAKVDKLDTKMDRIIESIAGTR